MAEETSSSSSVTIPSTITTTMSGVSGGPTTLSSTKEQIPPSSQHANNRAHEADASSSLLASSEILWLRLQAEAMEALEEEPELKLLLKRTVLAPGVSSFEEAVAMTVCYRLLQTPCNKGSPGSNNNSNHGRTEDNAPVFCPNSLFEIMKQALLNTDDLELHHTMSQAVRYDALAVIDRDPACDTLLEVVLFMKGFAALVCHRAARQKWIQSQSRNGRRSLTALFLQSQASAVFGVDIHPAATMGAGILLDHGTGIVIGETARVGDGCTLLHEVTLGGTGKQHGDRHPKIGPRVLIGAGAKILGNIQVGAGAKIGAGSIVLKSIPPGATAVGAPAKIIGRALEMDPASTMDEMLHDVGMLHKSQSDKSVGTYNTASSTVTNASSNSSNEDGDNDGERPSNPLDESRNKDDFADAKDDNDDDEGGVGGDDDDDNNEEGLFLEESNTSRKPDPPSNGGGNYDSRAAAAAAAAAEAKIVTKKNSRSLSTGETTRGGHVTNNKHHHHYRQQQHNRQHQHTHHPRQDSYSSLVPPGCVCPYRDYTRMALTAPKNSITLLNLKQVLAPYGCTHDEIGCTLFGLDTNNVGYIRWSNDNHNITNETKNGDTNDNKNINNNETIKDALAKCLANNTTLSAETIAAVVQHFETTLSPFSSHPSSRGAHSKKPTRLPTGGTVAPDLGLGPRSSTVG